MFMAAQKLSYDPHVSVYVPPLLMNFRSPVAGQHFRADPSVNIRNDGAGALSSSSPRLPRIASLLQSRGVAVPYKSDTLKRKVAAIDASVSKYTVHPRGGFSCNTSSVSHTDTMSSQSSRNVRTQPPTTLMGIHHSPSIRNRILLKDKRRRVVPPSFSPYKCVEEPSKVVMDSTVASTVKLPVDAHVNDSKELLHFESFVRNRHNEIDWVATFLRVGFEASSIYALLCPLRKGRWKAEEEQYTMGLLRLIENGTIILRHGQSIRGYISEKLHSDDMRVLKKLSNCKMFHFAKLIHPRLAKGETLDMNVVGSLERLERLEKLKMEFLRSVQLEALVAVRKYLSDGSVQHTDVFK